MLLDELDDLIGNNKTKSLYQSSENKVILKKVPQTYKKPKRSLFSMIIHPFESVGLDKYHLYLRDAQRLMAEESYVDAAGAFNKASVEKPKSLDAYFGVVECLENLGGEENLTLGLGYMKKALHIDYKNVKIYDEIIYILDVLKQKVEATEYRHRRFSLRAFAKDKTNNSMLANNLGVMLLGIGLHKEAVKFFQKSLVRDATFYIARLNLAKAWYAWALSVDKPKLKKLYLKNSDIELSRIYSPEDAQILLLKGKIELHSGNYEVAKGYLEEAYHESPAMREIYATLQLVNEKMGNIKDAIDNHTIYENLGKR
ncbi:MAG: hypothetical protein QNL04_07250 [SAR324 cluster bacterium]|nr:hypothetical protein [SAR324 cluster bacterium]